MGLALVLGGLGALSGAADAATAVTIENDGCGGTAFCYLPPEVTIPGGETVTWTNQSGGAPHTVTRCTAANCGGTDGGTGPDPSFDIAVGNPDGTAVSQTFNGAGTYNYYCKIHNFMRGTVTVQQGAGTTTTAPGGPTTTTSAPGNAPASPAPAPTDSKAPTAPPAAVVAGEVTFTG